MADEVWSDDMYVATLDRYGVLRVESRECPDEVMYFTERDLEALLTAVQGARADAA